MSASLGTVKVGKRVVTASYACGKAKACAGKASAVLVLGKARFSLGSKSFSRRSRRQGQPPLQALQEAAQGRQGLELARRRGDPDRVRRPGAGPGLVGRRGLRGRRGSAGALRSIGSGASPPRARTTPAAQGFVFKALANSRSGFSSPSSSITHLLAHELRRDRDDAGLRAGPAPDQRRLRTGDLVADREQVDPLGVDRDEHVGAELAARAGGPRAEREEGADDRHRGERLQRPGRELPDRERLGLDQRPHERGQAPRSSWRGSAARPRGARPRSDRVPCCRAARRDSWEAVFRNRW